VKGQPSAIAMPDSVLVPAQIHTQLVLVLFSDIRQLLDEVLIIV
jgi:hypothetical protein